MTAIVTQGHADSLYLPNSTVDLIITSPPYFSLRSYQDGGEHYEGQIGAEASPSAYLDRLLDCTREWMRVLKPSGSIFLNLGDKYGPTKSLGGLPWRYAIRCMDELGLILRAELIWAKPNGLPESVKDRVRRSHETWFHFTLQPRYHAAVDEIREPTSVAGRTWEERKASGVTWTPGIGTRGTHLAREAAPNSGMAPNPLGKLPGSVWDIATQPLRVPAELDIDHFAAFPMEWPRRLILGWSPREVCTGCGEGRRPAKNGPWHFTQPGNDMATRALGKARAAGITPAEVAEKYGLKALGSNMSDGSTSVRGGELAERLGGSWGYARELRALTQRERSGCACACPDTSAPATPGVVLDPFGGTGTTALVASVHGRVGISVDLSADYCRLAQWRTSDPAQRERAARPAASR